MPCNIAPTAAPISSHAPLAYAVKTYSGKISRNGWKWKENLEDLDRWFDIEEEVLKAKGWF